MPAPPTAAIIGAGSSGIAAAKALHERGIAFTCFEASDRVGGNWVFGNRNGISAAYRQLHINTSRDRMEYSDFPMPKAYPHYPHHAQIAAYFDAYVDHLGLRDRIRFETKVQRAERGPRGGWALTVDDGSVQRLDTLLVANGHHWNPRWPEPAFPARTRSPASRSTPTATSTTTCSRAATRSCSAWATARWTSPSRPPTWPTARSWPRGAARGSSPSTSSGSRPTSSRRTRGCRSRSARGSSTTSSA